MRFSRSREELVHKSPWPRAPGTTLIDSHRHEEPSAVAFLFFYPLWGRKSTVGAVDNK